MASSSSSSLSAPTISSQLSKYKVFLNFRGVDTRKNFVDHLYTALEQKGIYTYKDDETLPRGKIIRPSLIKAIEESYIAVTIFSKNYASSPWCLDELDCIMKCRDTRGLIVIPVFHKVDPSMVRYQKGSYGLAFFKHKLKNKKRAKSWRKALVDASNISGWETKHIANGHESTCIKEIVDTISHRLHPVTSSVDDNLVGVEDRVQDLISKLKVGFGGKKMIGIWGVGGGGKTTLASVVYDQISSKFDGCCFIKNVREESSNNNGLENLQKKILYSLLQQQLHIGRVEEGRRMIKDRLQDIKVLIVLDDVDNLEHLQELAGSHDWFGDGSRIIITTRDEHVLTGHKVDVIHNISLLSNDEAMKLFCNHAPRGHRRIEDYEQLSKDVVSYAGGLPLALRVLGRFLCDKETNEWRSALARLKEIPDANILEVLKISFDGLTPLERELFLDIACFFRGCLKDEEVMMIFDACGFHPVIGIKVLVQKTLITITEGGVFDMHDLIEEMAHYIVRGEHPKNPAKHSRVWEIEDVLKICAVDEMTNLDRVEAIQFQNETIDKSQCALQVVANMKRLRWISLNCERRQYWADDNALPSITMPDSFPPRELCCLTLWRLDAKQLWEGYKYLPNLRMIALHRLPSLSKTPNFEGISNLERFIVEGCPLLEEIHPSFGRLENLLYVEIQFCKNLKMLPSITRSMKLETVIVTSCPLVYNLSNIQQNMENSLPHNMNHTGLRFIRECLTKMDLSRCNLGDGDIGVWELPNLQELNLEVNRFTRLSFSHLGLPRLKWLNVSFCFHLVELSELPSSISVVIAYGCISLESFGDISNCKWLWNVSLNWKNKLYFSENHANKLGPLCGDILLQSMLQGNARDYFISMSLSGIDIWRRLSVRWVNELKTCKMQLPNDWYNGFSGILMFFRSDYHYSDIKITIKQGLDKDFQSQIWRESNESRDIHSQDTYVGYVSFSSLRQTGCLNSTYNLISFSSGNKDLYGDEFRFRAVLVPKDDLMQTKKPTTDPSEFWDENELSKVKTFEVQHDSDSSVDILWKILAHRVIL